ncbi:hypothetical protein [Tenacibaculum xiamenense]|uniref:hypothetical protein n=1 Tax=Tenacibaculum xiamenense TaxID=1261553 RepID=UPI003894108E
MIIKKYILIINILLCGIVLGQSQASMHLNANKFPEENIFVHNNSNFLLTGETLYYNVFCLSNDKFSQFSKVAYLELINNSNKSVVTQKITLKEGTGYGDIFINENIETGTYKIIAYTNWMKNKKSFFEKNIFIVNPFSNNLKTSSEKSRPEPVSSISKNASTPNLFYGKEGVFSKREKVTLNLNSLLSKKGTYSISIKQKNNFELESKATLNSSKKNSSKFYLPELRGSIIHGKVTSKQPITSSIKLSLSKVNNKGSLPLTAVTNSKNEFYFNISDINTEKLYIQILENKREDYKIELLEKKPLSQNYGYFPELYLNDAVNDIIDRRSIYSQIENAYYSIKKDSIAQENKKNNYMSLVDVTYKLDDYKRFKTVKETFVEIIDRAGFTKYNGKQALKVTNLTSSLHQKHQPTLLIIDGRIVVDHEKLLDYDARKINSISLVKNNYFYGNTIYQGVIIINTFKNDFFDDFSNFHEIKVLPNQPEKKYFFQNNSNAKNERIPDFRTQLYWNPNIGLKTKEVTFYTSDVAGEFEIDLVGYTDQGKFISLKRTFSVQ